jgi:hypothetical protein
MPEKKKQHFVPRFYLKYFSDNKKSIGIYNLDNKRYIKSGSLKNQAYEDYFYGKDGEVENLLAVFESDSAKMFSILLEHKEIPPYHSVAHVLLLTFVVFLSARTKYSAETINEMVDKQFKEIYKNDSKLKDSIDNIKIGYDNPAAVSLAITSEVICLTRDLKYKLLINKTDIPFVTSDNPVVKYNQYLENKNKFGSNTGFVSKGFQMFFPISPEVFVIFYDPWAYKLGNKKDDVIKINEKKDINSLNLLQIVNANHNIYFNKNIQERLIKKYIRRGKLYFRKTKGNIKEYFQNKNSSLIHS